MADTPLPGITPLTREATPSEAYIERALAYLDDIRRTRSSITAEDVRDALGPPPTRGATGAAFKRAAARGLVTRTNTVVCSTTPGRRSALIRVWTTTNNEGRTP